MRALCALGIIAYHFAHYTNCAHKFFLNFANGLWGEAVVVVFFALSGAMLYHSHQDIPSLKQFYLRRARSIFPMFYVTFLVFYIGNVIKFHSLFYRTDCSPWTLLLTLIGMDGYLRYAIMNYYIVGEWFIGPIIILYLLYPLLLKGIKRLPATTTSIVIALYFSLLINNIFTMDSFRNIFSCIISFYFGMLLFKYKEYLESNKVLAIAAVIMVLEAAVPLPFSQNLSTHLLGFALFIVLYRVGIYACKIKEVEKLSLFLGKLSYPIFLVQHEIVTRVCLFYNPYGRLQMSMMLLISTLISVLLAFVIARFTSWLTHIILPSK